MADKKISALTSSATPLAGTEVLPIVQSGSTVKVAVSDLTAGRAVSALSITMPNTEGATAYTGSGATIGRGTAFLAGQAELYTAGTRPLGVGTTGAGNLNFYTGSTRAFYIDTNQNLVVQTAGKGIDFSANTHAAGMTSELLNDYEEGTWTPTGNGITYAVGTAGKYTKIGNLVTCTFNVVFPTTANASNAQIQGLPFTSGSTSAPTFGNYSSGFNGFLASGNTFVGLVNTTGTAFIANSTLSTQTLIGSITYQV